jgi:aminoglycoside 6'-N-acetyltransferase
MIIALWPPSRPEIVMELHTSRLLLRPFRSEDIDAFRAFADHPGYRRYLGPNHPTAEQLVANNVSVDWERAPSWVIEFDRRAVGSIFLGIQQEDSLAELACLLAPDVWGQGIAIEAGRAVLAYAFGERGLYKVFARADAGNAASCRAMEKAGMRKEGVLRAHRADAHGTRVDEVMYGLTRDEWQG